MTEFMAFIAFVSAHAADILSALTALVTAASLVANITPTATDNKIVSAVSKVVNFLALNLKK